MPIIKKKEPVEEIFFNELEDITSYNMKQIEHCLTTIGRRMCSEQGDGPEKKDGRTIIESTILKECMLCQGKEKCQLTLEDRDKLGELLEKQGGLSVQNIRSVCRCQREKEWVDEINTIYERELFLYACGQRFVEMRRMIGEQYIEAGRMFRSFAEQKYRLSGVQPVQEKIEKGLKAHHLKVKKVYIYEDDMRGKQIYLFLKAQKGRERTTKEVARWLSVILQEKLQPLPNGKQAIGEAYEMMGVQAATKFHVLTGVISRAEKEDMKNGDNFSVGNVGNHRFVSMISDGMGTGNAANKDSKAVIETLEELLEVGLDEKRAIQLLQSIFVFWPEKERYSTLDYIQIDLHAGIGSFLKLGACPCFLKRKGQVEMIQLDSLPVGVLKEKNLPIHRKKLEAEDFILQVSDGIIDSLGENGVEILMEYMSRIHTARPQGFVDELMEMIENTDGYEKKDDMTMIGLGIWDKY
ncbi:SpoIIE family protein phosphatase [Anaerostipes sp.]|uniref:SpoIIE family protein phosphatase n=1 Tax=Anaerostipes sp. TaxID=1872530 RepID=UPI0025BB128E|nr:SpoIIE family protein phosphatase [Anaerostipes sp.]MBS7006947.1 SpoIIE family protein phosphatase [Anaerostipes sp.]